MKKDLERLILETVWDAQERALASETNMKAVEREGWQAFLDAYSALVNLRTIARPQGDIVELIDQLLPKIEEGIDELNPYPNAPKPSIVSKKAKSHLKGEIATALAELYKKEKQRIAFSKWQFVAHYMDKYLPEEYQPHHTSDTCQAWKDIVRHHKSRN